MNTETCEAWKNTKTNAEQIFVFFLFNATNNITYKCNLIFAFILNQQPIK